MNREVIRALGPTLARRSQHFINSDLLVQALARGAGAEVVLRSRVYIKQAQKDGSLEELLRGPFDLLRWYQNLCLESIADYLAGSRKQFVKNNLPKSGTFLALCDQGLNILGLGPHPNL